MIHALLSGEPPLSTAFLGAHEQERLAAMKVPWRRADFLLGRWTAKRLIGSLLHRAPDAAIEVLAAPSGQPRAFADGAPLPMAVSLSHRAGLSLVAVDDEDAPLGADLEHVEPRSCAFVRDYFTLAEQQAVSAGDPGLIANLIWSAKESALKALGEGLRLDSRAVEVELEPAIAGPWQRLNVHGAIELSGFWRRENGCVLTLCGDATRTPVLRCDPVGSAG